MSEIETAKEVEKQDEPESPFPPQVSQPPAYQPIQPQQQPAYGQQQVAYGQQQVAYGQQQAGMSTATFVTQPAPAVVVVNNIRGDDCLTCSILNMIFCNLLLGALAVAFSCMAREAYDRGDNVQGRSHYKVAKVMNILGPICTVLTVIIIIVYFLVIVGTVLSYG